MKTFNINNLIKVRLTDHGKDIFYHQHDEFNRRYGNGKEIIEPRYPDVDEDGFTIFQLWHFMEIYGPYISITAPNFIENNNIYIEESDLKNYMIEKEHKTIVLGELLGNTEVEE